MKRNFKFILGLTFLILISNVVCSQLLMLDSSATAIKTISKDSTNNKTDKKKHIPRVATIRSAIFPGLGQIYNKEYWKLPIVYGALAIPTYTFFYNDHYYSLTKYAYEARYNQAVNPTGDTSSVKNIDPQLKNLSLNSLLKYRNAFRQDRDYSIMWFFIVWGLNVIDATVFAHLKDFNVSDNLAIKIHPKIIPSGSFNLASGIGLAIGLKHPEKKLVEIK